MDGWNELMDAFFLVVPLVVSGWGALREKLRNVLLVFFAFLDTKIMECPFSAAVAFPLLSLLPYSFTTGVATDGLIVVRLIVLSFPSWFELACST
jgi:hypothetical protein